MAKNINRVDELVNELETIENDSLKRAVERQIEEEKKAQEEDLLNKLRRGKRIITEQVDILRGIRKREQEQAARVKRIDASFTQFKKDGDWDKFVESL